MIDAKVFKNLITLIAFMNYSQSENFRGKIF